VIHIIDAQRGDPDESRLYHLKITLKGSKPPIWRRVAVRGDMRLNRLHNVVQIAMGWTDSHLHQFIVGTRPACTYFGVPDPECSSKDSETLNEKRYVLADLAPAPKKKFIYQYDFGDDWEHEVTAEKILQPDPAFKYPRCLAGANACPPEDCGGIYGYHDLLKILADPKHPDYQDMTDWIGGDWDATRFDLDEINSMLKRLKA
jgi:hypothetical protein